MDFASEAESSPQGPRPASVPPPLPPLPPLLPPVPVIPLDYYAPAPSGPAQWVVVATCSTAGEWHAIRQALTLANLDAMMRDDSPLVAAHSPGDDAFQLLVKNEDVPWAQAIINAHRNGQQLCPHCGAATVRNIPAAWYWYLLAIPFLGLLPYWPATKCCDTCGRKFR